MCSVALRCIHLIRALAPRLELQFVVVVGWIVVLLSLSPAPTG